MNANIKIQYFGTLRLIYCTKEETIQLKEPVTFMDLVNDIDKRNGFEFQMKANHLMFFYYPEFSEENRQFKFPRDKDACVKSGSLLKIFNALTLG